MGHATLEITEDIGKVMMPGCGVVGLVAEPEHSREAITRVVAGPEKEKRPWKVKG